MTRLKRLLLVALFVLGNCGLCGAQPMTVTAGANHEIDFNEEINVPYSGLAGQYFLSANLRHLPEAGPMIKHFQSPIDDTGQPILLDAQQPLPQRIDEEWQLLPATSFDVSDWHEHFRTEGFVWVIPDDTTFPGLFPPNTSLITKNREPHPWEFVPGPTIAGRLDVVFPPIPAGEVLDIHKALLWVGTNNNRIWGDDMLNGGTFFDESRIDVWEFPTPEPTAAPLLLIGSLAMLRRRSKPRVEKIVEQSTGAFVFRLDSDCSAGPLFSESRRCGQK